MVCGNLTGRVQVSIILCLCCFSYQAIAKSGLSEKQSIIEKIDQVTKSLPEKPGHGSPKDAWKDWSKNNFEIRKNRIAVIDELKKFQLSEKQLKPYIEMQIGDIKTCFFHQRSLPNKYEGILHRMHESKSRTERTLATELFWYLNIYHVSTHLMHLSEKDVQTIADFELSRKDQHEAGRLMAKAIRLAGLSRDERLKWSTWITDNMPPESEGHKLILARNSSKTDIGKVIDFKGVDIEGNAVDSKSLRGKVVLVDYWAFWCGFCLLEMPEIKDVYEEYYDDGFRVVGVFNDHRIDELKDYLKEKNILWTQLINPDVTKNDFMHPLAKRYGISSLPKYLLIDKDGKLVSSGSARMKDLKPQIIKLLSEKGEN